MAWYEEGMFSRAEVSEDGGKWVSQLQTYPGQEMPQVPWARGPLSQRGTGHLYSHPNAEFPGLWLFQRPIIFTGNSSWVKAHNLTTRVCTWHSELKNKYWKKRGKKKNKSWFTLRIQACVYAPHEVQIVSGLEIHQIHKLSRRRQGGSRSGYHPGPATQEEAKSIRSLVAGGEGEGWSDTISSLLCSCIQA